MPASERRSVDVTSLVAGVVIVAFGTLLLLDRADTVNLQFGFLWPAITATVGAILLASGLSRRRR
jgi:hypothetical protein